MHAHEHTVACYEGSVEDEVRADNTIDRRGRTIHFESMMPTREICVSDRQQMLIVNE